MTTPHAEHQASTPIARPTQDPGPLVEAGCGPVRGVWRNVTGADEHSLFARSAAFYGIPYAEAPVGLHRFMAPVPCFPWTEVLDAVEPGATPQRRALSETPAIPEPIVAGEDILNLNVFTPAPGQTDADLPVLVWVHGGGYQAGSPSSPWYDGAAFNRDGVVTVSISYRVAFEGFGYVEGSNAPVNRGLRDQIMALRWVRDNIRAFGGDPDRVTLAGQSAGGGSVMHLLTSPLAKGLFSRVITHSGVVGEMSMELAQERAERLAEIAGTTSDLAGWQELSDEELGTATEALYDEVPMLGSDVVEAVREAIVPASTHALAFGPVHGDDIVPVPVDEALADGVGAQVPLLAGATTHEFIFMGFLMSGPPGGPGAHDLFRRAGMSDAQVARVEEEYPDLKGNDAALLGMILSNSLFHVPLLQWLRARRAAQAEDTWLFHFDWRSPRDGFAAHCLDLPFAFDCLSEPHAQVAAGGAGPQELADAVHADWVAFIDGRTPDWPAWGADAVGRVYGSSVPDGEGIIISREGTPFALEHSLLDAEPSHP